MKPRKSLRSRMRSELMPFVGLVLGLVTMPRVAFAACPPLVAKRDSVCEDVSSWGNFVDLVENNAREVVFCPFSIRKDDDDPAYLRDEKKSLICPSGECVIEGPGKHMEVRAPSIIQGFTFTGADDSTIRFYNLNDDNDSYNVCDCTFTSNNAGNFKGGALRVASAHLTVENSFFEKNQAKMGGAIYLLSGANAIISNSVFQSNQAQMGGAIFVEEDTTLFVNKNRFEENSLDLDRSGGNPVGAAVYLQGSSTDFITDDGNSGTSNFGCNGFYVNGDCIGFKGFVDPTNSPTISSSETPSEVQSDSPTVTPSEVSSDSPSATPSKVSSDSPSATPSEVSSESPTGAPTENPTNAPVPPTVSPRPSQHPSKTPSNSPSDFPTAFPTNFPSSSPTQQPTTTSSPTNLLSSSPSNLPSSSPTEEDIDLTIPEPDTASFPVIEDESSLPDGYFNYNIEDRRYGPTVWDKIDTSSNMWKTFFTDQKEDLLVKDFLAERGKGIEDDAEINTCNSRSIRQAPINVGDSFTSACDEYHQFRNRRGRFDALTYKSKVTLSVLPNMLRVDFDRSGIQGDGKHLLLPNFPMSDGPNYLQPINAVNVQVTVPSQHTLNGKRYHAEYSVVHWGASQARDILFLNVLINADVANEKNFEFQRLLDGWAMVGNCGIQKGRRVLFSDEDSSDNTTQFDGRPSASNLRGANSTASTQRQRKLQDIRPPRVRGRFNVYHNSLIPSTYFYGYKGSLFEPPCMNGRVHHRVFDKPMQISPKQYKQMKDILLDGPCKDDPGRQGLGDFLVRPLTPEIDKRETFHCTAEQFATDCERFGIFCPAPEWAGPNPNPDCSDHPNCYSK